MSNVTDVVIGRKKFIAVVIIVIIGVVGLIIGAYFLGNNGKISI